MMEWKDRLKTLFNGAARWMCEISEVHCKVNSVLLKGKKNPLLSENGLV